MRAATKSRVINHREIARRRKDKSYTMEEAAKLSGIGARQRWYKLESGKCLDCAASTLRRVAKFLGCKMEDLMITSSTESEEREA